MAVKGAVQVDIQAALPRVGRHLGDRLDLAPPCVVDEGVNPAAPLDDGMGDGTHRVEVGHVERHRQELSAVLIGELLGERAATAFMGIRYHHVVVVGGEAARNRGADTGTGRRGDECHPAFSVLFVSFRHLVCLHLIRLEPGDHMLAEFFQPTQAASGEQGEADAIDVDRREREQPGEALIPIAGYRH